MNRLSGPRFLNTILLGGDTAGKLDAAAAAGFAQVELWREDVASSSVADVRAALTRTGLQLTDVQVLLDFDGASAATREGKRAEALSLLALAHDMGAGTVLVPACTATDYVPGRVTDDLRWLCARAAERGLRIAYEGMAWSRLHSTLPSTWQQIEQVGAPNLDIVVDAFHLFAAGRTADDLRDVPVERIALVQLSDVLTQPLPGQVTTQARHHRCLPGDGLWPLETLIDALAAMGYRGPIGLEVFNDALKARDPHAVAREAMAALEAVLTR
ncbi:sugar phosphate isomerase/epimerase family protein [Stenotrophomonas sp.]|uniref:sugar phosphate isomerase/epimerase family protein n=1 Tax=Stenotrophomonas sp. TaxID=69392 RepID=UPI0029AB8AF2|nr:sugar phosphate isomerase/epimerase family protein [Stenotrophomonas sp.]MDX3935794.1 sugar phosphate isomerase/epimerase family protein [Stenotrophomonas sp.]